MISISGLNRSKTALIENNLKEYFVIPLSPDSPSKRTVAKLYNSADLAPPAATPVTDSYSAI